LSNLKEEQSGNAGLQEVTFGESKIILILMIMIIPFYLGVDWLFNLIWKDKDPLLVFNIPTWSKVVILVSSIFVHELIHGLIFAFYAPGGFRSVRFGFSISMGSPYCHCKDAIRVKHYRLAGIAPLIILGIIPLVFAFFTGINWIKIFGLLLCIGGFGDLLVWIKLLKYDSRQMVKDHPTKMGFLIDSTATDFSGK
jgi:hypothetical protein